jgi:cell division transport system permease protein
MSGSYDRDRPPGSPRGLPPPAQPLRTRTPGDAMTGSHRTGPPTGGHGLPPPPPGQSTQPFTHGHSAQHGHHQPAMPYSHDPYYAPHDQPEPATGPISAPYSRQSEFDTELRADTQTSGSTTQEPATAPIVPAGSVTGRSLTLVVSIMCFLACLTAGAVYMVNQVASAWLKDVASEITIQIEPRENLAIDRLLQEVVQFIRNEPGIASVRALSREESSALIEPWLGKTDALKALPIPRMIAVVLDRNAPPELGPLRERLNARFKAGVALDDHRIWQQQIKTVTRSLALGGLAILMLVGAATTAIIISATRSAMASNREIVEVLHFVGATDRFIAREFEKHFLRLGIRAGVVGAFLAMLVFLLLPTGMTLLGGQGATMADLKWMIGSGALDAPGYVVLVVVVVVISCLCMLTSRFGVYRILNGPH